MLSIVMSWLLLRIDWREIVLVFLFWRLETSSVLLSKRRQTLHQGPGLPGGPTSVLVAAVREVFLKQGMLEVGRGVLSLRQEKGRMWEHSRKMVQRWKWSRGRSELRSCQRSFSG